MIQTCDYTLLIIKFPSSSHTSNRFFFSHTIHFETMAGLRDVRDALLLSYDDGIIDDEESLMLYDINLSRNDYPYWNYERFDLENMDDAETWSEFGFLKNDIFRSILGLTIDQR